MLLALPSPPLLFFGENVAAAGRPALQPEVKTAFEMYENAGYEVVWALVRADLHGVPQKRERVYYVAYKRELGIQCDLLERFDALKGGASALLSHVWGAGHYYFHSHSRAHSMAPRRLRV